MKDPQPKQCTKAPMRYAGCLIPAALVAGIVAAVLLMVWARAFYGSVEAYHRGEESLRQNQTARAITYFDRAIHWYTPWNPYVERSAQKLWQLSTISESKGDYRLALAALTSLKSGYVAAAGLYAPGQEWIKRCEDRMQALLNAEGHGAPSKTARNRDAREMQKPQTPPAVFWPVFLEIGLLGWIGWTIRLIVGFRRKAVFVNLLKWGLPLVLFYAMWIVGMMLA